MADQVEESNSNNTLLVKNEVNLQKKEFPDEDSADVKVHISETVIIMGNTELQDHLICDKKKWCDVSTALDNIKTELSLSKIQNDMIPTNLKTEERSSTNDIKMEFNNGLIYCEDCQAYREDYCVECEMLVHILNKTAPVDADNRLQGELPQNNILGIQDCFGQFRIFALKVIPAGVRFGPFTGLSRTERSWKIKCGKVVLDKNESKYLNWMQYINSTKNISEQNLLVFQYEHDLYYESTCQIEKGDELLVYFGEDYEHSLDIDVEIDFIPIIRHIFKDAFACIFCCLGFSSKSYLVKHKTICPGNAARGFSIEELTQCPSCKIHLDQKEYIMHHMAYCCERNDRMCMPPTSSNRTTQVSGRKTRQQQIYKCQQCRYRTKYKGDLKNHTNQHYKLKIYQCGICDRQFKTIQVLKLHVKNTHISAGGKEDSERSTGDYMKVLVKAEHACPQDETKQFKCSLCEFRTKYNMSLKHHMKVKHLKEFKYKCATCDYRTNFQTYLKAHIETRHLKEFKYKCDACDYKTNMESYLKQHMKWKHFNEFQYECDICDYKANFKSRLKTHIQTIHLQEFNYKCDTCDYKTNVKSRFDTHVKARHLKEFKYKCDTCEYRANLKAHLDSHVKTKHLKEFKYKCDICDYKANQKSQLKNHIKTKHLKEFKYKCDRCDYKANMKSHLDAHVKAKHLTKEFKYKCDACDYKANVKYHLVAHVKARHSIKDFKYKCDACDYKANVKYHLDTHVKVKHLKEFKYKCDECDYKANVKYHLNAHVKARHLEEFKYKCESCDYKSNYECRLKIHMERKHLKEVKYKCDTCDFRTNRKSDLKTHVKIRH